MNVYSLEFRNPTTMHARLNHIENSSVYKTIQSVISKVLQLFGFQSSANQRKSIEKPVFYSTCPETGSVGSTGVEIQEYLRRSLRHRVN